MFPKEVTGEEIRACSLSEPTSEGEIFFGMYFSAESLHLLEKEIMSGSSRSWQCHQHHNHNRNVEDSMWWGRKDVIFASPKTSWRL